MSITLSKQLFAFALISLGLTAWLVSRVDVDRVSAGALVNSANRLIDRSEMTPAQSQELDRAFRWIVHNDQNWLRQTATTLPVAVLGFVLLSALFAYAAWAARRLERQLAPAPSVTH